MVYCSEDLTANWKLSVFMSYVNWSTSSFFILSIFNEACNLEWCLVNFTSRELKHARFWDADGKRKWAVFPYNSSSHNYIYNAKYLSSIMDDQYKNMGDTTVLAHGMFSSGCRPRLKDARA